MQATPGGRQRFLAGAKFWDCAGCDTGQSLARAANRADLATSAPISSSTGLGRVHLRCMQRRAHGPRASRASIAFAVCVLACTVSAGTVHAKPEAPRVYCMSYADSPSCVGRVPECKLCHVSTFPASWNDYGQALKEVLAQGAFEAALPKALTAVEALDSDMDGVSNRVEIALGTMPGDGASVPTQADAGVTQLPANPDYRIGQYDPAFAYKRASLLYCGKSPTYEDMQPFREEQKTSAELGTLMHERIEKCLQGDYWLKDGLMRLADDRVRPIRNLGQDSQVFLTIPLPTLVGEARLRSVMGDYRYDYRLWVHALSGNRDARDLLLAQYYVEEDPQGR
jgi:hypothetical protein